MEAGAVADRVECPACAESIKARARICRFCGYDVEHDRMPRPRRSRERDRLPVRTEKNPGLAAVFAFLYPGLGHVYCGALGLGIGIMVAPPILLILAFYGTAAIAPAGGLGGLWLVVLLAYFMFFLWQVVDAYNLAERMNRSPHRDLERVFGGSSGRRARRSTRRRVSGGRPGSRRRRGSR